MVLAPRPVLMQCLPQRDTLHPDPTLTQAMLRMASAQAAPRAQGPPGTGKTAVIVALVSALHAQRWAAPPGGGPAPAAAAGAGAAAAGAARRRAAAAAARVLVCAQSNAAVDELVVRLAHGFLDSADGAVRCAPGGAARRAPGGPRQRRCGLTGVRRSGPGSP